MIKSFRDKETEKIFNRLFSRKLPQNIQHIARRKLVVLDAAPELNALRIPPGNKLESLKRERKDQHSIRIKGSVKNNLAFLHPDFTISLTDLQSQKSSK